MSDGFAFLDIIFFAMVAAFVAVRLRGVLGKRTGNERRRTGPAQRPAPAPGEPIPGNADNVIPLPDRANAPANDTEPTIASDRDDGLKQGITQIRLADRKFDLDGFLGGAKAAFGMVVEAFARGDKQALRPLLADQVWASFEAAIDQREADGQTLETELVSMRSAEVTAAELRDHQARVTVRFKTEQINTIKGRDGAIVGDDPPMVEEVIDLWTFARDVRSSDPNWALVETRSGT